MSEENETGIHEKNADQLVKSEVTQLRVNLDLANDTIKRQAQEIADLKMANAKLKERAETEVKSKLIDEIQKYSTYGIDYLVSLDTPRLEQLLEDCKTMKLPRFSSSGDFGGGVKDPYEKLHNMFKFGKK